MSVLLLCSQIIKDFNWEPFHLPPIKFSTLFEIYDLIRHPQFDRKQFFELVYKFNGFDSVNLVCHLLETYFDTETIFIKNFRGSVGVVFTRKL